MIGKQERQIKKICREGDRGRETVREGDPVTYYDDEAITDNR